MDCPVCKGDNREGARFCRHCGAELAGSPVIETKLCEGNDTVLEESLDVVEEAMPDEFVSDSEPPAGPLSTQAADEESASEAAAELDVGDVIVAESLAEDEFVAAGKDVLEEETGVAEEAAAPVGELGVDGQQVEHEELDTAEETSPTDEPPIEEAAVTDEQPAVSQVTEAGVEKAQEDSVTQDKVDGPLEEAGSEPLSDKPEGLLNGNEVLPPPEWIEDDLEDGVGTLPDLEVDAPGFWREETEKMSPMAEGMVIADRYMVLDILDAQDETILYYVRDLRRCWQCGHEGNAPDEAFCSQCGAALDRKPGARLLEVSDDSYEPETGDVVTARLEHEGRKFLVLVEPEPKVQTQVESQNIRLVVGQSSDAGLVRELDEDSLLTLTMAPTYVSRTSPVLGLFAVADGMGGHEGGEVASKIALQVMGEHVLRTIVLPEVAGEFVLDEDVVVRLRQAIMEANDQVYLARQKRGNDMGTTLTAVLVRDGRLFLAHVGDCRAYRWNADGLQQLTTDHSVVASMIATGRAEPEDIYTHPHRSVIYRCIGDQPAVQVDTDALKLTPEDRIIVCCDGLWEMIRNEGIEDVMMQEAEPQAACDLLVKRANAAGGEDNISVIVVQVESV